MVRNATTMPVNSQKGIFLIYGTLNGVYITLRAYFGSGGRTSLQVYPAPDYTSVGQFGSPDSDHRCSL